MPRVLRLITRLNIGGPARQALLLTRELAGSYPTVLASGEAPEHEGELADPAVAVRRVPLVRPVRPAHDLRAVLRTKRMIDDLEVALVHSHMAKAGTVGRVASRLSRRRPVTVHTFHGHVLEGYFGRYVERAFVEVERRLARTTDALVAVSQEVRDQLLDLGIGDLERFRVIPLGFELDDLLSVSAPSGQLRSAVGVSPETPLVGIVGRLAPIKDHRTLLEAVSRVPSAHLAVLGDGPLRPDLEELARHLGMAERVHFLGWWLDIPAAMSDLDIVALTSRNEGTPVALIEAAAAGRPTVSTDVGGVRSVVLDGETGLLAEPGDVEGIAERLSHLLSDPDLRATMGRRGRDHVAGRFGSARLVADIRRLYDELLSAR